MKFNGIGDEIIQFIDDEPFGHNEDVRMEAYIMSMEARLERRIAALESLVAAMADEIARLQPNLLDGVMDKARHYRQMAAEMAND